MVLHSDLNVAHKCGLERQSLKEVDRRAMTPSHNEPATQRINSGSLRSHVAGLFSFRFRNEHAATGAATFSLNWQHQQTCTAYMLYAPCQELKTLCSSSKYPVKYTRQTRAFQSHASLQRKTLVTSQQPCHHATAPRLSLAKALISLCWCIMCRKNHPHHEQIVI